MKINELSKLSRVNAETIRMYRNKGFLFPQRSANGYYEYSEDDLQNLLYIRKLRGLNLSLNTISYTYDHPDADDIVAGFRREYDALSAQIDELCRQRYMLQVTMDHYESYRKNLDGVMLVEVPDERFDMPFDDHGGIPEAWMQNIGLFTQGLRVPEALIRSGQSDGQIPVQLTLGTYAPILEAHGVAVPPEALRTPPGTYLAVVVERHGKSIDASHLRPLLDYAQAHGLTPTGESTAFLFRVSRTPDGLSFTYRLRVRVEKSV